MPQTHFNQADLAARLNISPRTLERWPLIVRRPNKAAIYAVEELLSVAKQKFEDACAYKQEVC